jgi:acyl carrier protein
MKKWFSSLFRGGRAPADETPADEAREDRPSTGGDAPAAVLAAGTAPPAFEEVMDDLVRWICANSSQKLAREDVDPEVQLYDAGYVDSLKGAEMLVHIEKRYGLFIPETQLGGKLGQLDSLVRHIVASARGTRT